MDVKQRVGWNVRRLRTAMALTQEKLAETAQLNQQHLSDIERGKANFTLSTIIQVADALKVDVAVLFEQFKSS